MKAYIFGKLRLCRQCPVPLPDAEIIWCVVWGLRRPEVAAAVMSTAPETVEELLERVEKVEEGFPAASSHSLGGKVRTESTDQERGTRDEGSDAESRYHSNELECLVVDWAIEKLQCYVFGRPFKVVTDNLAVVWLQGKKEVGGKLGLGVMTLQEHDILFVNRKGKANVVADALSRNLRADSKRERENHQGYRRATRGGCCTLEVFEVVGGTLYRKEREGIRHRCLAIPQSLQRRVLELGGGSTGWHLGVKKTLGKVRERFWWEGHGKHVKRFVRSCTKSQMCKQPPGQPFGLLQLIPTLEKPFEVLGINHVGPLQCTTDGNKYLLIVMKHGAPKKLISVWGSAFTGDLLAGVLGKLGVEHALVAAYHPQTNGLCERANHTLLQVLSTYLDGDVGCWDNTIFLVYERLPMLPEEATFPWPADAPEPYDEFLERVERARQIAASRTDKEKVTQSHLYNRRHREAPSYVVGDLVLVSDVTYKVGDLPGHYTRRRWIVFLVHVSQLNSYIEGYIRGDTNTGDGSSSPYDGDTSDDNAEECSVVEACSGGNLADQSEGSVDRSRARPQWVIRQPVRFNDYEL
ncbi:hypothetical protein J437_LFUL007758 [Ladona fulva]|uniref:RNA-directed DNA polymerase n=1 Tax=Ladona fulva TaxID=123851 RepID=A0A8K0K7Q3_LADFU|nr:hypothetical protein J437_LFUL007758 [Ladona fulva]